MPERILRDLTDSEAYNAAPVHCRDLFIRFINKADDFGLYFADARRLRPLLYPLLLDAVREADLQRWTAECGKAGLVRFYEVDGRKYLYVNKWRQRLRNKRSKFPKPPWGYGPPPNDSHLSDKCQSSDGHPHTETEAHTETDTPKPPRGDSTLVGFEEFWTTWPDHKRKDGKKQTLAYWRSAELEAEAKVIIACLNHWKKSEDWTKAGGAFIPAPLPWLRKENWKTATPPPPPMNGVSTFTEHPGHRKYAS